MSDTTANERFLFYYGEQVGWSSRRTLQAMFAAREVRALQHLTLSNGDFDALEELADLAQEHFSHLFLDYSDEPRTPEASDTPAPSSHSSSHRNKHVWQHVAVHGFLMVLGHFLGHKHR